MNLGWSDGGQHGLRAILYGKYLAPAPVALTLTFLFFLPAIFQRSSKIAEERQRAVLDDLQSALRRHDRSIRGVRVFKPAKNGSEVTVAIRFENDRETVPPPIIDEVIRLLWLSRLYPLKTINIHSECNTKPYARGSSAVRLDRAVREQLRHRYGPRPYGPLPPNEPKPDTRPAP